MVGGCTDAGFLFLPTFTSACLAWNLGLGVIPHVLYMLEEPLSMAAERLLNEYILVWKIFTVENWMKTEHHVRCGDFWTIYLRDPTRWE